MIPPTNHPRADYDDNPWERAHTIPDMDAGPGWLEWIAKALVIGALLAAVFIAGRLSVQAAERQAATCMEGCP